MDLPDGRFNQILIFGLLHHLPDADVRGVLAECRRLLGPGGRVLVIEDIPAVSRVNVIGHLIHRVENGEFIRPVEDYRQALRRGRPRATASSSSRAASATTTPPSW